MCAVLVAVECSLKFRQAKKYVANTRVKIGWKHIRFGRKNDGTGNKMWQRERENLHNLFASVWNFKRSLYIMVPDAFRSVCLLSGIASTAPAYLSAKLCVNVHCTVHTNASIQLQIHCALKKTGIAKQNGTENATASDDDEWKRENEPGREKKKRVVCILQI